jgi:hypothetical protein
MSDIFSKSRQSAESYKSAHATELIQNLISQQGILQLIAKGEDSEYGIAGIDITTFKDENGNRINFDSLTADIPEDTTTITDSVTREFMDQLNVGPIYSIIKCLHNPLPLIQTIAINLLRLSSIPNETIISHTMSVKKLVARLRMINIKLTAFLGSGLRSKDLCILTPHILQDLTISIDEYVELHDSIEKAFKIPEERQKDIQNEVLTSESAFTMSKPERDEVNKLAINEIIRDEKNMLFCEFNDIIGDLTKLRDILNDNNNKCERGTLIDNFDANIRVLVNGDQLTIAINSAINEDNERKELDEFKSKIKSNNEEVNAHHEKIKQMLVSINMLDEEYADLIGPAKCGTKRSASVSNIDGNNSQRGGRHKKTQRRLRKNPRVTSMKPKKRQNRRKTKSTHKKRGTKKH